MSPEPVTPRLGLSAPTLTDPADVPFDLKKLRDELDPKVVPFLQGPSGSMPAAGIPGRLYFATDLRTLLYDDGATWQGLTGAMTGDLKLAGSSRPQPGWLLCDGAAYPRADYAALYANIGDAWGAGDGSSTFNVPELRGRALLGAGAGPGLTNRPVGGRGGAETHTLSAGEMPVHAHGVFDPSHAHGVADPGHSHGSGNRFDWMAGSGGQWYAARDIAWGGGIMTDVRGTGIGIYGAYTGVSIYNAGGGAAHANMPPWAAIPVFIKT